MQRKQLESDKSSACFGLAGCGRLRIHSNLVRLLLCHYTDEHKQQERKYTFSFVVSTNSAQALIERNC